MVCASPRLYEELTSCGHQELEAQVIIAPSDESIGRCGIVNVRLRLSCGLTRFAKFGAHGYPISPSRQPLVQGAEDAGRQRRRTRTRVRRQRNLTWWCGSGRCSASLRGVTGPAGQNKKDESCVVEAHATSFKRLLGGQRLV